MLIKTLLALLLITAVALADQKLYSSITYLSGGSKACSYCIPPPGDVLQLSTSIAQGLASIPIAGLKANEISSVTLNGEFYECQNQNKYSITVGIPQDSAYKLTAGFNGCNSLCPYVAQTSATLSFNLDSNCQGAGVNVTAAVKAALAAGNDQFVFVINAQGSECNIMGSSTVNCQAKVNTKKLFLNVVSSAAPTTAAPTSSSCQQTIYSNKDTRTGSSPGGTSCGRSTTGYDFTGNFRGSLYVGFPIDNIPAASHVAFYFKGSKCVNANRLSNTVSTVANASATFGEEPGINNACPFINTQTQTVLSFDNNCLSQGVDVTAAFNAARGAGNKQLVLSTFSATKYVENDPSPNYCNRFATPNIEPHFDDSSNCGVHANGRDSNPSSWYIVVTPTSCPSAAPTTAKPTTPGSPSTKSPTSEPPVQGPSSAPTTKAPGSNISGDNNARADSGAATFAISGLVAVVAVVALL